MDNQKADQHAQRAIREFNYSRRLCLLGEYRARDAARDRARQHLLWQRYFRRWPDSTRNDEVG